MPLSASDAEPEKPKSEVLSEIRQHIEQSAFDDELYEGDDHEPLPTAKAIDSTSNRGAELRATATFDPISVNDENQNLVIIEANDKSMTADPNNRQQFDDESI